MKQDCKSSNNPLIGIISQHSDWRNSFTVAHKLLLVPLCWLPGDCLENMTTEVSTSSHAARMWWPNFYFSPIYDGSGNALNNNFTVCDNICIVLTCLYGQWKPHEDVDASGLALAPWKQVLLAGVIDKAAKISEYTSVCCSAQLGRSTLRCLLALHFTRLLFKEKALVPQAPPSSYSYQTLTYSFLFPSYTYDCSSNVSL